MKNNIKEIVLKTLGKKEKTISGVTHGKEWVVQMGGDFTRHAALELYSLEIKRLKVPGAVAELGVYRGEFAKLINTLFPTKKLYLFDTFTGFHQKDIDHELSNNLIHRDKTGYLS
jgi:hypothetical protein